MAMVEAEGRSTPFRPSPAVASGEKLCEFVLATDDPYLIQTVDNAILRTIIIAENRPCGDNNWVPKLMHFRLTNG